MKKITLGVTLICMTLIAKAQSSVTINITNGSPPMMCCPTIAIIQLFAVNSTCTSGAWHTIPVPTCGVPVTYTASALCAGCTNIIAGRAAVFGSPATVGDNPAPCFGPYVSGVGGGGGASGCQWEATWFYSGTSPAQFNIN